MKNRSKYGVAAADSGIGPGHDEKQVASQLVGQQKSPHSKAKGKEGISGAIQSQGGLTERGRVCMLCVCVCIFRTVRICAVFMVCARTEQV